MLLGLVQLLLLLLLLFLLLRLPLLDLCLVDFLQLDVQPGALVIHNVESLGFHLTASSGDFKQCSCPLLNDAEGALEEEEVVIHSALCPIYGDVRENLLDLHHLLQLLHLSPCQPFDDCRFLLKCED